MVQQGLPEKAIRHKDVSTKCECEEKENPDGEVATSDAERGEASGLAERCKLRLLLDAVAADIKYFQTGRQITRMHSLHSIKADV
jgi:hypothetical protein